MGFWDGVQTILLDGDDIAFLLPDDRLVSAAEMDRRERAYKAGRDPDAAFSPDVEPLVEVRPQTTAPSSGSESVGGP